jgi:alkyl hydroperoxide reductase subunit AhpC
VIDAGRPAPPFRLPDTNGTPVDLRDLTGGPVLLMFLPAAFTPVCSAEFAGLARMAEPAARAGAQLVAIACDSMFALRAWAAAEGVALAPSGATLLLSDFWPHGEVARSYGVFDEGSGIALRGTFLIDADGIIRWCVVNPRGRARDLEEYRVAVAEI